MKTPNRRDLLEGAPWPPTVSSWVNLLALPLAGAIVTAVNLLRLNRPDKALLCLAVGLASFVFLLITWSMDETGDFLSLSYVILTIGNTGLFLYLQTADFRAWRKVNRSRQLASGWGAVAWALVGLGFSLMIAVVWLIIWNVFNTPGASVALIRLFA